jgi:hypothetical protein
MVILTLRWDTACDGVEGMNWLARSIYLAFVLLGLVVCFSGEGGVIIGVPVIAFALWGWLPMVGRSRWTILFLFIPILGILYPLGVGFLPFVERE